MAEPLTWHDDRKRLGDLTPRADNPRYIDEEGARRLVRSYAEYEQPWPLLVNPDGTLLDGHQRLSTWIEEYGEDFEVDVRIPSRPLTQKEWQRLTVLGHEGAKGEWDFGKLNDWGLDTEELTDWGFDAAELEAWGFDFAEDEPPVEDAGAQVDAEYTELDEQWLILVECQSEHEQIQLLEQFDEEGIVCRALIS